MNEDGVLTQPKDIAADFLDDGGTSWIKTNDQGSTLALNREFWESWEMPLPSNTMMQASSISKKKICCAVSK